jgi:oligopeptidase B
MLILTDILRYSYQSLATPSSVIDFNMKTKEKEIKKSKKFLEANLIKIII